MAWRTNIGAIANRPQIIRHIALAWLVLLVVGSLQPNRLLVVVGSFDPVGLRTAIGSVRLGRPLVGPFQTPAKPGPAVGLHRGIHWLAFGGASFLLLLLSRSRRQEIRSVIAMCLLGLSLEYLQYVIYQIDAVEWPDVRDDVVAILVAFALYLVGRYLQGCFPTPRWAAESETVIPAEAGRS